jgi:hypothetical protein
VLLGFNDLFIEELKHLENIRRIIRSVIAESDVNLEKIYFPELGGWKAVLYANRSQNPGYAIINNRRHWVGTYDIKSKEVLYNKGGSGKMATWVEVEDLEFQDVEQAARFLFIKEKQEKIKRRQISEHETKRLRSDKFQKLRFPDINYTAEIYFGGEFWDIYDVAGIQAGMLDSNGRLYKRPEEIGGKFRFSGMDFGSWDEKSVHQAARFLFLSSAQTSKHRAPYNTSKINQNPSVIPEIELKNIPWRRKVKIKDVPRYYAITNVVGDQFNSWPEIDIYDQNKKRVGWVTVGHRDIDKFNAGAIDTGEVRVLKDYGSDDTGTRVKFNDQGVAQAIRLVYLMRMQSPERYKITSEYASSTKLLPEAKEKKDVIVFKDMPGWGAILTVEDEDNSKTWNIYDDSGKEVGILDEDGVLSYKIPGSYFDSPWLIAEFNFDFDKASVTQAARWVYLLVEPKRGDKRNVSEAVLRPSYFGGCYEEFMDTKFDKFSSASEILRKASEIFSKCGGKVDFTDFDGYYSTMTTDAERKAAPKPEAIGSHMRKKYGILFALFNKYVGKTQVVVDVNKFVSFVKSGAQKYDLSLRDLLLTILHHEDVHRRQIEKHEKAYRLDISPWSEHERYIASPAEIMAYARSAAEELTSKYSPEFAIKKIADSKSTGSFHSMYKRAFKDDNPKTYRKFLKYLHMYLSDEAQRRKDEEGDEGDDSYGHPELATEIALGKKGQFAINEAIGQIPRKTKFVKELGLTAHPKQEWYSGWEWSVDDGSKEIATLWDKDRTGKVHHVYLNFPEAIEGVEFDGTVEQAISYVWLKLQERVKAEKKSQSA